MNQSRRIGLVIPARNEDASIADVLAGIKRYVQEASQVVVVDDASDDRTGEIASQMGAVVISLPVRLGAWRAAQAGIRYLASLHFDVIITLDADGQHLPQEVLKLLAEHNAHDSNVVIGSSVSRGSALRHVAWALLRFVSGVELRDITSGLRLYDAESSRLVISERATCVKYQDLGVLMLCLEVDLVIREVQVAMYSREAGSSRVFESWFKVLGFMSATLLLGLAKRRMKMGQGTAVRRE